MNPRVPPSQTDRVYARNVLVLAPHYDDEVLGCGGLVAQLAASGARVAVMFLSDGAGAPGEPGGGADYALRRRAESEHACRLLGVVDTSHVGLPDGMLGLPSNIASASLAIADRMRGAPPDLLLVPSPLEISTDHRAAAEAAHDAIQHLRQSDEPAIRALSVLLYDVNHASHPNLLVDVSAHVPVLEAAMACYASQQERHDYLAAALGLRRFRTLTLSRAVTHAEGYRRLSGWDLATRSFSQFVEYIGGAHAPTPSTAGPLVSVVVRTRDRPRLLEEALASVAHSSYRHVEVILVNDGGAPPAVPSEYPFPLVRVNHSQPLGRAAAAQAGVDASHGECLTFLDDDDVVAPEHLATLVEMRHETGAHVLYTDAAVTVYELNTESGWTLVNREMPYAREFDPDHLLVDNYIPLNTVLIDKTLLDAAGPFDRSLEIFEDWDMLIRLVSLTPFHHVPRVTCEYRQFRGSRDQALGENGWRRPDFLEMKARVLAKHAARLDSHTLARVVVGLRADVATADQHQRQAIAAAATSAQSLNERLQAANTELQRLFTEEARLAADLAANQERERRIVLAADTEKRTFIGTLERLEAELQRTYTEESRLTAQAEGLKIELARVQGEESRLAAETARSQTALLAANTELERVYREEARLAAETESLKTSLEIAQAELQRVYGEEARLTADTIRLMDALEAAGTELHRVYGEEARLAAAARDFDDRLMDALERGAQRAYAPSSVRACASPIRKASVLIASWNGREHLETCLEALAHTNPPGIPWDCWVLDNGSQDGTVDWLRERHPDVRLLASPENLGFCAAYNRLVSAADGDLLLFLNNDTHPAPDWLGHMVESLASAPADVASAAGLIVDWTGERLDFGRGVMTFDGHAFQLDSGRRLSAVTLPASGEEQLFGCGGNMIVRRESFLAAGGFDEQFFAYFEDVDFGWRLWSGGERVIAAPRAVVRHRSAGTSDRLGQYNRGFLFERNAFLTAYKNYEAPLWEKLMPALMLTLISRTTAFLTHNNPGGHLLGLDPFNGDRPQTTPPTRGWFQRRTQSDHPVVSDQLTIAQCRALTWLTRNMDAVAERRQQVQARRQRSDMEIFSGFPLHIVPTYSGDDTLFRSAGFQAWLPETPRLVFRTLDEIMART